MTEEIMRRSRVCCCGLGALARGGGGGDDENRVLAAGVVEGARFDAMVNNVQLNTANRAQL